MTSCAATLDAASDDALAALVAELDPTWSVLVAVSAADRGDARRALPGFHLITLDLQDRTLSDASRGVIVVPGRCVVLARRRDDVWDVLATPGGWEPAPVVASPVPVVPPQRAGSWRTGGWIGGGFTFGFPSLGGLFVMAKVGPIAAEVAVGSLGPAYFDGYVRGGLVVPLGVAEWDHLAGYTLGLFVGPRAGFYLFGGDWSGVSTTVALDRLSGRKRVLALVRCQLGVDVWTRFDGVPTPVVWPSAQVGIGGLVSP